MNAEKGGMSEEVILAYCIVLFYNSARRTVKKHKRHQSGQVVPTHDSNQVLLSTGYTHHCCATPLGHMHYLLHQCWHYNNLFPAQK